MLIECGKLPKKKVNALMCSLAPNGEYPFLWYTFTLLVFTWMAAVTQEKVFFKLKCSHMNMCGAARSQFERDLE